MAETYRRAVPLFVRLANRLTRMLVLANINVGPMGQTWLLTVRGRKSGLPRTTPVTMVARRGKSYLFAPYGAVDWVRNLRASGGGTLQHGRRTETFTAVELTPQQAAPIMQEDFATVPAAVRQFFAVTPASSLEDFEREAERHPVFEVTMGLGVDNREVKEATRQA
jgi:deazaflavin-dependent oxidoreductase (nitroreductase family)